MLESTLKIRSRARDVKVELQECNYKYVHYLSDGTPNTVNSGTLPWVNVTTATESIVDELSHCFNKNVGHQSTLMSSDFRRTRISNYPTGDASAPYGGWSGPWDNSDYTDAQNHFESNFQWKLSNSYRLPLNQDELANAMFQSLPKPEQIASGFSMGTFIAELRELKDLFKIWDSKVSTIKNIAGAHLNVSFGWIPFLSDSKKIYDRIINMQSFIKDWNEQAKKGEVRTYHYTLEDTDLQVDDELSADWQIIRSGANWRHQRRVVVSSSVRRLLHTYIIPCHIDWDVNKYVYQYKAMGLHRPLDTIWNVIPFSFVVDWFTNVGDMIRHLERDDEFFPLRIHDVVVSSKESYNVTYSHSHQNRMSDGTWYNHSTLADVVVKAKTYKRRRIHPPIPLATMPEWEWKPGNLKQWLLGLSLIVANSK